MKSGVKVYRSHLLREEFAAKLQAEAARYAHIERARSKKTWFLAEAVNREWDNLDADIRAEVSRDQWFMECSTVINSGLEFPIVGQSGETLRRWCNVAAAYANIPAAEEFKEALSFDHFFRAKSLYERGKIAAPLLALAEAYEEGWTVEEMLKHYDPDLVTEYDRVMDSLSAWEGYEFEWLTKAQREKIAGHVKAIREILEEE
jgi:hypothetical protein